VAAAREIEPWHEAGQTWLIGLLGGEVPAQLKTESAEAH
jgi:hypothetical protein